MKVLVVVLGLVAGLGASLAVPAPVPARAGTWSPASAGPQASAPGDKEERRQGVPGDLEERRQGVPGDPQERRQGVPGDTEERRQGVPVDQVLMCPMHPDFTADAEGRCPRCGMALVRGAPFDVRDYRLAFQTSPAVVRPGAPARLRFAVSHPGSGERIRRFELVHEKPYHLFVIGADMQHFEHIHPEQQPDGAWEIDVRLPKAGYYRVLSDFVPGGGAAQLIARPLVTAGYQGDLIGDSARLVADTRLTKTVDDLTATLALDPPTFVSGLYGHLNYRLTDASTGRPVSDLQPYLGAFGHTLVISEDGLSYVHAHPLNIRDMPDDGGLPVFLIPPDADLETLRGGPDVTFDGLIPKPGRYKAWTQFRRHDRVYTFAFTFEASEAPRP